MRTGDRVTACQPLPNRFWPTGLVGTVIGLGLDETVSDVRWDHGSTNYALPVRCLVPAE